MPWFPSLKLPFAGDLHVMRRSLGVVNQFDDVCVLVSKGVGCGQGEGKRGVDFLAEETA